MALPILDGNQTSVTLATTVSGGAHYPNHIIASSVTISSIPAISGTVTANFGGNSRMIGTVAPNGSATTAYVSVGTDGTPFGAGFGRIAVDVIDQSGISFLDSCLVNSNAIRAFGSVTIAAGTAQIGSVTASISNSVTIGSLPSISGTVTANNPNGTLTTRFGSVNSANTAQITTAVTNTSRKYLLCQNNQTGTSAGTVTIGIGFTPTTTQGIQLISGASYTADSFLPTGAVYWLGSVTGATFTILEG